MCVPVCARLVCVCTRIACVHTFLLLALPILVPLDAVHHETAVLLLLLRTALHHHYVAVLVQHHRPRQVQLVRVRLHLELLGRVAQVVNPGENKNTGQCCDAAREARAKLRRQLRFLKLTTKEGSGSPESRQENSLLVGVRQVRS